MAERLKAAVLKIASPKGDGGSNPSPSDCFFPQGQGPGRIFRPIDFLRVF